MSSVEEMIESKMESQEHGSKLLSAQGLDPKRLGDVAPMDDGLPPVLPQGVKVTPFMKALDISWTAPPISDNVRSAVVEVTPSGGVAFSTNISPPYGLTLVDLDYIEHSVRVKFIDAWGRESGWTTPVLGTPAETADFKINLAKAQMAGRLEGLVPAINTSIQGGDSFAANTVKQVSLAQPDGSNLLPLIEVDFDQWPSGQVWAPTETDKAGNRYITELAPVGVSGEVVDRSGIKWLRITRNSTTDGWYVPFGSIKNRGIQPGTEYIFSGFVRGNSGVRARLVLELYKDTAGTDRYTITSDVVTLDGSAEGKRIAIRFTAPAGYNTMRVIPVNPDDLTSTEWTKFQLEYAGGKLEPSPWSPGILTTGMIVARALTALDLSATQAIFKNAAIDSAAVKELVADKIVGGTISTTTINILSQMTLGTGGKFNAGPFISLNSGGMTMARTTGYTTPSVDRAYKISSSDDLTALAFYVNGTNSKGIQLRADGSGGVRGAVALQATYAGDFNAVSSARIEINAAGSASGRGQIFAEADIYALGDIYTRYGFIPTIATPITTIGAGSARLQWVNKVGRAMRYFFPQAWVSPYGWAPLGWSGGLWASVHTDYIYIHNSTGVAHDVWWAAID